MEWVEIIEPRTKEYMYANLTTGECVWDPPSGVCVKKTDSNQWWELFDQNTSRFYYYNATSQKTIWHRPSNCDIIPLAKLQTLKQNTEPVCETLSEETKSKESVSTQTHGRCVRPAGKNVYNNEMNNDKQHLHHKVSSISCETQTSPSVSPKSYRKLHHHSHKYHVNKLKQQPQQQLQQQQQGVRTNQSQDSGRSSDSSSRTSLDTHRVLESPHRNKHQLTNMSTSTSTPIFDKKPLQEVNSALSKDKHDALSKVQDLSLSLAKHRSFDVETSLGVGGCYSNYGHENLRTRSKGPSNKDEKQVRTPATENVETNTELARSYSFVQRREAYQEEEDSMHEKYFIPGNQTGMRSVESTPQARRKQTMSFNSGSKCSRESDSGSVTTPSHSRKSPHGYKSCPYDHHHHHHHHHHQHHHHRNKRMEQDSDDVASNTENESSNTSLSPVTNSPTSPAPTSQKMKLVQGNMFSSIEPPPVPPPLRLSDESKTSTYEDGRRSGGGGHQRDDKMKKQQQQPQQQHMREFVTQKEQQTPKQQQQKSGRSVRSDSVRDRFDFRQLEASENGNISASTKFYSMERNCGTPLYSNVDYSRFTSDSKTQAHLLPLHQYILEQAKLSGCYKFGDSLLDEMESVHSEDETSLGRPDYDSDEFADDEGMSNQGDSSSQEYLDEPNYYEQHELLRKYTKYPPVEYKNNVEYIESLESRMAVNTVPQGVYYSPISTRLPPVTSVTTTSATTETQHTSLKRKKDSGAPPPAVTSSNLYSPIGEKQENANRPISLPTQTGGEDYPDRPESPRQALSREKKLPSESDIEKYAQGHLNLHKKGIFRKKFSVRDMLSWSKDPIRKPMLVISDKAIKKDACELFKLVQIYMSDRKAKVGMTLNGVALDICSLAHSKPNLRDELYIQICRQTTENPRRESLRRGWELMAICLNFVPPSAKFQSYLEGYMNRHRDPGFDFPEVVKWPIHVQISHYATVSCKRLERIGVNGKKVAKKPTIEEIDQARLQIFRASMFGNTLEEVMHLQKERFPNRRLPWVQTILSEEILRLQGAQTEGIFRVSADVDEVNCMKMKIDHWEVPTETVDAHAPASLLKLWYRELYEPLIPDSLYSECVTHHDDPEIAIAIVQRLPNLNKLVLCYLIRYLQIFSRSEVVQATKMDASNLAMVIAPNCLRCTSQDPRVIFDNARKEMGFIRTLIQSLDTSFMDGVC